MRARRPWAWPLVPLYAAGIAAKDWLRRVGWLREKTLAWPVVSVGSLSAGGAGKTPVVIALAGMLQERGWVVDVLSRGYGRAGRGVELVQGEDAQRFGDEPVLVAQRTEVPVWVGADRFAAGLRAEEGSAGTQRAQSLGAEGAKGSVHLLDDGFQHRGLARAVDIVLVTAEDLEDALLPAGNRREPVAALRRADVVVVREEEMDRRESPRPSREELLKRGEPLAIDEKKSRNEELEAKLRGLVRPDALVWTARRKLRFPAPLFVFGAGLRPVAFCSIARPEGFAEMLERAGCGIVETVFFDDHHAYAIEDIERVVEVAKGLKATGLVTTEKDAVKLSAAMRAKLETVGPFMVAALEVDFMFPERVMRELEARLVRAGGLPAEAR